MPKQKIRTRNGGRWTEAEFITKITTLLRQFSYIQWKTGTDYIDGLRRPCSNKGRQKWEYPCEKCHQWFPLTQIKRDHNIPVGGVRTLNDLPGYCSRLFIETGWNCLCETCHQEKTNCERRKEKWEKNNELLTSK